MNVGHGHLLMLMHLCRSSAGHILEALHVDPASAVSLEQEKNLKMLKTPARYLFSYLRFELSFSVHATV